MELEARIVKTEDGEYVVLIPEIIFVGKRSIDWHKVREYLSRYTNNAYQILSTEDIIYIGKDFADEYTGSKYTYSLKGANAKAKANAVQGLPQLIEIAVDGYFSENKEDKHRRNAAKGWYRFKTQFALPVYEPEGGFRGYNLFRATLLIRHSGDGHMYLYDILDIKKRGCYSSQ